MWGQTWVSVQHISLFPVHEFIRGLTGLWFHSCYFNVMVRLGLNMRKLSLHWSSEELIQVSEISPKKDTCKCLSVWVCQPMTCAHAWLFPLWHTRFLLHKTSRTQIITLIYTMHPFPCVLFMLNWLEWKPNWRWLLTTADSDVSLCLSMLNRGQVFCEWMFGRVGGVRALWQNCKAAEWTDVSQWLMFLPALPQRICVPMHL